MENCFASLITHGRNFDEGIKKLAETWRYPHNVLGGYGANADQAKANLKILEADVAALKEEIAKDAKSRGNHMNDVDRFLGEAQNTYEDLLQSCNDIEIVLSEYGYTKSEDETPECKSEIETSQDLSLIPSDVTDDLLEVEFTPNMTWRHKTKTSAS